MNAVLQAKNRECDDLRRRLHHYEASVEKLGQAEARIESLNDEIERLNIIVTEKGRDAETLRQRLAGTEKGLSKWREIETKYDILQSEY
jgi:predicted RNase H-like nuclease (RuvC/YqgF family)